MHAGDLLCGKFPELSDPDNLLNRSFRYMQMREYNRARMLWVREILEQEPGTIRADCAGSLPLLFENECTRSRLEYHPLEPSMECIYTMVTQCTREGACKAFGPTEGKNQTSHCNMVTHVSFDTIADPARWLTGDHFKRIKNKKDTQLNSCKEKICDGPTRVVSFEYTKWPLLATFASVNAFKLNFTDVPKQIRTEGKLLFLRAVVCAHAWHFSSQIHLPNGWLFYDGIVRNKFNFFEFGEEGKMTDNGAWEPDMLFYEVLPENTTEFFGSKCMDWNNVVEAVGNYMLPKECDAGSNNAKGGEDNEHNSTENKASGSPKPSQQEIDDSLLAMKKWSTPTQVPKIMRRKTNRTQVQQVRKGLRRKRRRRRRRRRRRN